MKTDARWSSRSTESSRITTFGFAQVDVDGKSGLIDRDGKMIIEPKYGFVRAIGPDRFGVSERRRVGGLMGSEDFSGRRVEYPPPAAS